MLLNVILAILTTIVDIQLDAVVTTSVLAITSCMFAIRRSDIPTFQLKKLSIVGSDDTAPFVVPQQWKYFLQRYSSEYDSICVNQATKLDQQQIANDVGRTGYDLNPIQIQHLETVLLAMSVKCSKVGYCQGLNTIAAFAMIKMNLAPADVYSLLVSLCTHVFPIQFANPVAFFAEAMALDQILHQTRPGLGNHMTTIDSDQIMTSIRCNFFQKCFILGGVSKFRDDVSFVLLDKLIMKGPTGFAEGLVWCLHAMEEKLMLTDSEESLNVALTNASTDLTLEEVMEAKFSLSRVDVSRDFKAFRDLALTEIFNP